MSAKLRIVENGSQSQVTRPRFLTAADVARDLSCSQKTIYAMAAAGAFGPTLRLGRRGLRISAVGLEQYLEENSDPL
jgi:predicted DNA-binding transcriptional regulator AlpA